MLYQPDPRALLMFLMKDNDCEQPFNNYGIKRILLTDPWVWENMRVQALFYYIGGYRGVLVGLYWEVWLAFNVWNPFDPTKLLI